MELIGRLLLGAYFLYNSYNHFQHIEELTRVANSKYIPFAEEMVRLSGFIFGFAGITIIIGVLKWLGLWIVILFLLISAFFIHNFWKETNAEKRMYEKTNFLKNLALAASLLIISTAHF